MREVLDRSLESVQRLQVFHVADVLAEEGIAVVGQAEGVFEFAAHGKGWL